MAAIISYSGSFAAYCEMAEKREREGGKRPGMTAANGQLLHLASSACTRVKEDRRPIMEQLILPGHLLQIQQAQQ